MFLAGSEFFLGQARTNSSSSNPSCFSTSSGFHRTSRYTPSRDSTLRMSKTQTRTRKNGTRSVSLARAVSITLRAVWAVEAALKSDRGQGCYCCCGCCCLVLLALECFAVGGRKIFVGMMWMAWQGSVLEVSWVAFAACCRPSLSRIQILQFPFRAAKTEIVLLFDITSAGVHFMNFKHHNWHLKCQCLAIKTPLFGVRYLASKVPIFSV